MPSTIVKLVYRRDFFDLEQMRPGAKQVTTITDNGLITVKEYLPGSRKVHSVKKAVCSVDAFVLLCEKLETCIETADRLDSYCDDSSEKLTIYHKYGRAQIMDRGFGNEHTNIGDIIHSFRSTYL